DATASTLMAWRIAVQPSSCRNYRGVLSVVIATDDARYDGLETNVSRGREARETHQRLDGGAHDTDCQVKRVAKQACDAQHAFRRRKRHVFDPAGCDERAQRSASAHPQS